MVNTCLQVVGFAVGLLGFILSIITTFLPAWQKSDIQGENPYNMKPFNSAYWLIFYSLRIY